MNNTASSPNTHSLITLLIWQLMLVVMVILQPSTALVATIVYTVLTIGFSVLLASGLIMNTIVIPRLSTVDDALEFLKFRLEERKLAGSIDNDVSLRTALRYDLLTLSQSATITWIVFFSCSAVLLLYSDLPLWFTLLYAVFTISSTHVRLRFLGIKTQLINTLGE
jgi:hypothetical protein